MTPIKVTTIPIQPSTNVRSTQGDRWLFAVSDEYLEERDLKRMQEYGIAGRSLARKRQLEKYNAYKEEIRYWAQKNQFVMPMAYFSIHFMVPFPQSWRKPRRVAMDGAPHTNTPDTDNMIKALFDSILPRRNRIAGQKGADDRKIHCYTVFKTWCQPGREGIVISEYNPTEYRSVFFGE
jgi:Holliday junction resolvase RusA-like endonuclease